MTTIATELNLRGVVAESMRLARLQSGMTQIEFAKRLREEAEGYKIDNTAISKWENAREMPSALIWLAWMKVAGANINTLLARIEDGITSEGEYSRLARRISRLERLVDDGGENDSERSVNGSSN